VAEDRSVGMAIDDKAIWTKLHADFTEERVQSVFGGVAIQVRQGRVLLTGHVPTPEVQLKAVRMAWEVEGVTQVIDEMHVDDASGVTDYARDSWITTTAKSALLVHKDIKSINYSLKTINQTVYVIGIARSAEERRQVLQVVRKVRGVRQVVDYTRVRQHTAPATPEDSSGDTAKE
jgi:osmotically-inducible protein OsmY